jgi:hypothetical protein
VYAVVLLLTRAVPAEMLELLPLRARRSPPGGRGDPR